MLLSGVRPQIWIDRGGTFLDAVGWVDGSFRVLKVLATDDAAEPAVRAILQLDEAAALPPCDLRFGTTLATNALLEGRGAKVALITHEGLADLLRIDDQRRPELFAFDRDRPPPLAHCVLGVRTRRAPNGDVVVPMDAEEAEQALADARESGCEAVAIALLHATAHPGDELALARLARDFPQVTTSHEVDASRGLLGRAQTAVLDAALTPIVRGYASDLARTFSGSTLRFIQSSGGLVPAARFRGRDATLSGPAGGAVAVAAIATAEGFQEGIGFDMGGTSTDVCRVSPAPERRYESRVAGVRVRAPMVAIDTIAAGGGSVCWFDGRLRVGPRSVGADPGPLCYGRGGTQPSLTDAALVLGRIHPARFPLPLDRARAERGLAELAARAGVSTLEAAAGFVAVAVESMAGAIEQISIARGHDVREHVLVPFGGAAGQFACSVARRLGIARLVVHPLAGVLSAWGMGAARESWHGSRDLGGAALEGHAIDAAFDSLVEEGSAAIEGGAALGEIELRYQGAEVGLHVDYRRGDDPTVLHARFTDAHQRHYGYARASEVRAITLRVEVLGPPRDVPMARAAVVPKPPETTRLFTGGRLREVPLWWREALPVDAAISGPAVILEATGTLVVEEGFVATRGADDSIRMECRESVASALAAPAIELAVMSHAFMSIAERMGAVLERAAQSPNIRDRLDFSCAVFDATGHLVANAPHIPVHLGAMGAAVRAIAPLPMETGDVFATNDPRAGGSHLPDITVVQPVYLDGARRFFVAARGHHADVGGVTPGSMPPRSRTLAEEGVVLRGLRIVHRDAFQEASIRDALAQGSHPARDPDGNLADLEAQIAACRAGERQLLELCARRAAPRVEAAMAAVQDHAEAAVQAWITALDLPEDRTVIDTLDDGTVLQVTVGRRDRRLRVDFTGTAPAHHGNLNAPRSVVDACVLYVVRCLVGADIPLNAGCLRPVDVVVPPASLLDPPPEAAVAGGNVETSQRVVDLLLEAFDRAAGSQGTMNNLTLGNADFGYYETLAGGGGAGRDEGGGFVGPSALHSHMTNSRITDPEILEHRVPVRVRRLSVRAHSGGAGRWRGGDGVVRELEALAPLDVSVLAERRRAGPRGLAGGHAGLPGRDSVVRADGRVEPLDGTARLNVGDAVRVETPGGGGYGAP